VRTRAVGSCAPYRDIERLLRSLVDHFQSDLLFNLLLSTKPMGTAAGIVYFHHKGVFAPHARYACDRAKGEIAKDETPAVN